MIQLPCISDNTIKRKWRPIKYGEDRVVKSLLCFLSVFLAHVTRFLAQCFENDYIFKSPSAEYWHLFALKLWTGIYFDDCTWYYSLIYVCICNIYIVIDVAYILILTAIKWTFLILLIYGSIKSFQLQSRMWTWMASVFWCWHIHMYLCIVNVLLRKILSCAYVLSIRMPVYICVF